MENTPNFIKEFSKIGAQQERDETAKEIHSKRNEYFEGEKSKKEKTNENQENISNEFEAIQKAKIDIEQLNKSGVSKFLNYFKIRKLKADILNGNKSYEELKEKQIYFDKYNKQSSVDRKYTNDIITGLILNNFYDTQKRKWANSEYTKDDISKQFTEEHLASLSLEDYTLLMKRFPSEMITHVTRQGIRDHIGHIFHTAGEGEYHTGFMKIAEGGVLHSALSIAITEEEKKEKIKGLVIKKDSDTKEEVLERLNKITNPNIQDYNGEGSYADRNAIHFAAEGVADAFYGAEKGNEIFIAYPSAFIASQYKFHGQLTEPSGSDYNDQWIWANEEKGININTGIVFIPEDAKVNVKNGSRYEVDKDNNPIINKDYQSIIKKFIDSDNFNNFYEESIEVLGKRLTKEQIESFRGVLQKEHNITDYSLQDVILNYWNLQGFKNGKENKNLNDLEKVDFLIERGLKEEGVLYKETENAIQSKDYWENYFKEHPDQKPNKIVYYKGGDPTQALINWKRENRIDKKGLKYNLGFDENQKKPSEDPNVLEGASRFKSIGKEIIEEYFEDKKVA